jgi:dienelactone hydrolase
MRILLLAALTAATVHAQSLPGLALSGDPRSAAGATWTFKATRDGIAYDLQGILFYPRAGVGPFGGVVASHGKGGSVKAYSANLAKALREWGLVVIGTNYTHAVGVPLGSPGTAEEEGASQPNILRARLCLAVLRSLPEVDTFRLAAHGHSMGAYLTAGFAGTTPGLRAASHTAGGAVPREGFAAPSPALVRGIAIPYQMHHGDADNVVPLAYDRRLDSLLGDQGTIRDLQVYAGYDHARIALDTLMLSRVQAWYRRHGMLGGGPTFAAPALRARRAAPHDGPAAFDLLGRLLDRAAAFRAVWKSSPMP